MGNISVCGFGDAPYIRGLTFFIEYSSLNNDGRWLIHWPLGGVAIILKAQFSSSLSGNVPWGHAVELLAGKCHMFLLMGSQHRCGNGLVPSIHKPHLNQCWPRYMSPYGVTGLQSVNRFNTHLTLILSSSAAYFNAYGNHQSILHIEPRLPKNSNFTFHETNQNKVFNLLKKLHPKKAAGYDCLSRKMKLLIKRMSSAIDSLDKWPKYSYQSLHFNLNVQK